MRLDGVEIANTTTNSLKIVILIILTTTRW